MTILFITRKYPPSVGGMERFAFDLVHALEAGANIRLIKWGGSKRFLPIIIPYFFMLACWQLAKGDIDIIHIQDGLLAPLGLVLSRLFRRPFTIVIHGRDITWEKKLYQTVVPPCVRRANHVFCISEGAANETVSREVVRTHISVIPLGITAPHQVHEADIMSWRQRLGVTAETPLLLTVGRLVKRKGVAWFIDAVLPTLVKQYPTLVYVVVGAGPEQAAIDDAIKAHNLARHVYMFGKASDEELTLAYAACTVFVQPNVTVPGDMEGFGRVLIEAASYGLPVVAARLEGITEAIQNQHNGILVTSKKPAEYEQAIATFLNDKTSAKQFGHKAKDYTENKFSWEAIGRDYIAEFRRLSAKH